MPSPLSVFGDGVCSSTRLSGQSVQTDCHSVVCVCVCFVRTSIQIVVLALAHTQRLSFARACALSLPPPTTHKHRATFKGGTGQILARVLALLSL